MNILLSKEGLDLDEFYTISSYERFSELEVEEFGMVQQIRIDDFDLGLNCIFDLVNRSKRLLTRINFVINTIDPDATRYLQYFIRKYSRVYRTELELKQQHKYRSAYEKEG